MSDGKAPIDPISEDAAPATNPPPGTDLDPAKVVQMLVDPDAAADLDPTTQPEPGQGLKR